MKNINHYPLSSFRKALNVYSPSHSIWPLGACFYGMIGALGLQAAAKCTHACRSLGRFLGRLFGAGQVSFFASTFFVAGWSFSPDLLAWHSSQARLVRGTDQSDVQVFI